MQNGDSGPGGQHARSSSLNTASGASSGGTISISTVADVLASVAGLVSADHLRAREDGRESHVQTAVRVLSDGLRNTSSSASTGGGDARGRTFGTANTTGSSSTVSPLPSRMIADLLATGASIAAADHAAAREQGRNSHVQNVCQWVADRLRAVGQQAIGEAQNVRTSIARGPGRTQGDVPAGQWPQEGADFDPAFGPSIGRNARSQPLERTLGGGAAPVRPDLRNSTDFTAAQGQENTDSGPTPGMQAQVASAATAIAAAMAAASRTALATKGAASRARPPSESRDIGYASDRRGAGRDQDFCAICQDDFLTGDSLMRLQCFHEYHADCISSFVASASDPLCPSCRYPVTTSPNLLPIRVLRP